MRVEIIWIGLREFLADFERFIVGFERAFAVAEIWILRISQHIAALARHKSLAMALRYTRQAELLRCAPHAQVGVGV